MARTTTGTAEASLTTALQPVIRDLVVDMRSHLTEDAALLQSWQTEHAKAQAADRVGTSFEEWSEEQLQQAAAGWVLTTVFLRFIEDNDLFGPRQVFLTGYDAERRGLGRDTQEALYQAHPDYSDRAYLEHCFNQLAEVPATAGLVGPHAAIHIIAPSDDAARTLIEFFRQLDSEENTRWTFNDESLSTRFLGDLYQDLSEFARKKYALLQTPDFVEEFILDRTLTPALEERPLEGFKLIDPTCGSGHFLLGAFHRLVDQWETHSPAMPAPERAAEAMRAIHGVDINPFAVAITQFRLTVAYMQAAGDSTLVDRGEDSTPGFTVLAGDSLLFGPDAAGQGALNFTAENYVYSTENAGALDEVLTPGTYDVVVGNPPYVQVKDKTLSTQYKERFAPYAKGIYALSVPFMVRFFQLANRENADRPSGWVGQITANSFMQRQFGKPLIEKFFKKVDLREVIDTSGAYIPGHGTPTVILIGLNARPSRRKVLGTLGIQGEPGIPANASDGKVWKSITGNVDNPGYENEYVSVSELSRSFLYSHPWSLQGGAAQVTSEIINRDFASTLGDSLNRAGFDGSSHADDAFLVPTSMALRIHRINDHFKTSVKGGDIRDYRITPIEASFYPYDNNRRILNESQLNLSLRFIWGVRSILGSRVAFSGRTFFNEGFPWYQWNQLPADSDCDPRFITYAEVATHNHFAISRNGAVFNQSAPALKFPIGIDHGNIVGMESVLNSSIACFWLKQNSHVKGGSGIGRGIADEKWENRYQFASTTLKKFPLPDLDGVAGTDVTERGRRLDALAQELASYEPSAVFRGATPTQEAIDEAEDNYVRTRQLMIAEQEELDWAVYFLYGLTETDLSLPVGTVTGIALGSRPFEIALARRVENGETTTAWFERHHSTPVTDIPDTWPEAQQVAARARLDLMASDKSIKLLEAPEYKRRWADDLWADKVHTALADWLLTRLETPELWRRTDGMPQTRTVRELASQIETDPDYADVLSVLPLWSTRRGATVEKMLDDLLKGEAVPYVASLRYKGRGFAKRAEWEATWDAQRDEDAGEITAEQVPVPPNYSSADMVPAVWKHRGKLDVPKERFISYPGASPEGDATVLLGWAGWNDLDKGLAIFSTFADRADEDADTETLAGILAGLVEVLPWIKQWHNDLDPQFNLQMGDYLEAQLVDAARNLNIPVEDISDHAPKPATRGRKKK